MNNTIHWHSKDPWKKILQSKDGKPLTLQYHCSNDKQQTHFGQWPSVWVGSYSGCEHLQLHGTARFLETWEVGIQRQSFSMEKSWIRTWNLFPRSSRAPYLSQIAENIRFPPVFGRPPWSRRSWVPASRAHPCGEWPGSLVWVARYLVLVSNDEKCCNQDCTIPPIPKQASKQAKQQLL